MTLHRVLRGAAVAAIVLASAVASGEPRPAPLNGPVRAAVTDTIAQVRGSSLAQKLNKQVVFEGFYYDGSIPMVVDDLARIRQNTILPAESYVPLTGALPAGAKSGDRLRITAMLTKPPPTIHLQRESAVAHVTDVNAIQVLAKSSASIAQIERLKLGAVVRALPEKHAVLIAGGYNGANNHVRYWNDTLRMYNLLRTKGYDAANIKVVYADGVARTTDMPVDYSATVANLQTVFQSLAQKMTANDTLYVMVTDHGGGFLAQASGTSAAGNHGGLVDTDHDEDGPVSEAAYNLDLNGNGTKTDTVTFDEVIYLWGTTIGDDAFKGLLNSIPHYGKMIVQLNQCFSGGFLRDLAGPRRIVMAAASKTQFSWSDGTGTYEELLEHYLKALEGGDATADKNHDGKVSIVEAYEYARGKDVQPETPFYDDDGTYPPHSGAMPGGGEGTLGSNTFL